MRGRKIFPASHKCLGAGFFQGGLLCDIIEGKIAGGVKNKLPAKVMLHSPGGFAMEKKGTIANYFAFAAAASARSVEQPLPDFPAKVRQIVWCTGGRL